VLWYRQIDLQVMLQVAGMLSMQAIPLLLSMLVGLALGLVAFGLLRSRHQEQGDVLMGTHSDVLLALLVLGVFALGVFLTYVLIGLHI
jgi:hypothetical protein